MSITPSIGSLAQHSVAVILDGQSDSGAYVACPSFPVYGFGWLRDGAFCAYAMELVGQQSSADRFHDWVATTVLRHADAVERAIDSAAGGGDPAAMLPTRFALDGTMEPATHDAWPNFQLDGYGTWLWALSDHANRGGSIGDDHRSAAALVTRYLRAASHLPCFDCWEESGDERHTSTVAAIAAGLRAAAGLLDDPDALHDSERLRDELLRDHVRDGAFVKAAGDDRVDASLLWLSHPFGIVDAEDPLMVATVERIRQELRWPGGGVKRYLGDSYYGGGDWILLTAWLGWHDATAGRYGEAEELLRWIESTATPEGHLPEQDPASLQQPGMLDRWVERWGPVATPLLWSHAMYLVLLDALGRTRNVG